MKPPTIIMAALAALSLLLTSCGTTGGGGGFNTNDLFIAYTGNGVEIQNMAVTAPPGQEAQTANGVGYDLKAKTAYVSYVDGHKSRLKISGAGFGGGVVAIVLEDGSKVKVNVKTGQVTTEPSPWGPPPLPQK
jgi:predicted small secreted protein